MKKLSKILCLVLAVALICTGLILAVSADDSIEYTFDLATAITEAVADENGMTTVKLTGNAQVTEPYAITKDVTIDLNGYTLDSTAHEAFTVNDSVNFSIVGDGNITLASMLIQSTTTEATPNVTVKGSFGGINITHTAAQSKSILQAVAGTYTFVNCDVAAVCDTASSAVFAMTGSPTATFNFIDVDINVTGAVTSSTSCEAVISATGAGHVNITSSTIMTDGVGVRVNGSSATDEFLVIKDSYLCARNGTSSFENAAIGMYGVIQGVIKIENSTVESSYRVIAINLENQSPNAEVDENGVISTTTGGRVLVYDSILYHNGLRLGQIARAVPTFLYGNSKILIAHSNATSVTSIVNFDTDAADYAKTNRYVNIYMAEGTRVARESLTTKTTQGVKFPDGSSPVTSETYKFVYDPVGDPDAPYVVAKIDDTRADAYSDAAIHWFASGNAMYSATADREVVFQNDARVSGTIASDFDIFPTNNLRWNKSGIYSIKNYDGNLMFGYETYVKEGKSPVLNFGNRTYVSTADYAVSGVMVFELDLATNSNMGFPAMSYKLAARKTNTNSGDYSGASTISIANNGALTFNSATVHNQVSLSTESWNRISIVVDVANRTAEYFVNGVHAATATDPYDANAFIYGMRFDVTANQNPGYGFVVDNALMAVYSAPKTKTVDGETVNYAAADYLSAMALNDEIVKRNITVGAQAYSDLASAMVAAEALGTVPQVNADISGQTVKVNGFVSANGHTIDTTDGSYGANVVYDANGNAVSYEFNITYDAEVTYKWYEGELGNAEQLADPNNYFETIVAFGDVPTYNGTVVGDIVDEANGKYNPIAGWSESAAATVPDDLTAVNTELLESLGDDLTVTLYPVYSEDKTLTVSVKDNATGKYVYITDTTSLDSSVWSNFKANTTFKLYRDFDVSTSSGFTASENGATYNLDFNGHTIYSKVKNTYMFVKNGAILNIYSSVPGGMFYALENVEGGDKSNKVGAGVFVHMNEGGGENLENAKSKTQATTVNIGKVTVGDTTYDGSNLTLAGDCVLEPRVAGYNASFNIDGATMIRPGSDYGAMIFSRYYYGSINVKNTNFIVYSKNSSTGAGSAILGNHNNGNGAECQATFENCVFLFDTNGSTNAVLSGGKGFKSISFTNCVSNGSFNPANTTADVLKFGEGNLSSNITAGNDYMAEGIKKVYANIAMQMPDVTLNGYKGFVSQDANGVLKLKRWVFSNDTSIGANGGAADNGYLYIVPNGYEGTVDATDADVVIELPVLTHKTTANTVNVTFKGLGENENKTYTYAVGGNVVAGQVFVPEYLKNATKLVADGNFVEELATNLAADGEYVYTPTYKVEENVTGLKANLSLYSDFVINLYIPANIADFVATVNGVALTEDVVVINGESYVKVTVSKVAKLASEDAVFEFVIVEDGETVSKTVSISIVDYASTILAGEFTDADKILMYYMLNYVNEAAKYFENSADATEIAKLLADNEEKYATQTISHEYANALEDTGLGKIFASAGIELGEAPAFTLVSNGKFAGKVTVTYGDGNVREFNVPEDSTGTYAVTGMKIFNFGVNINITAVGTLEGEEGEQTITGTLNLDTYASYHAANTENEASAKVLPLIEALYDYVKVAEQYKAGTLVLPEETPAE